MLGGENSNYFLQSPNPYQFDLNASPQLPTNYNVNSSRWFQQQEGTRQEPANNDLCGLSLGCYNSNLPDCNLQLGCLNQAQNSNPTSISTSLSLYFPEDHSGMTSTSQDFLSVYGDLWVNFAHLDEDTNTYMQQKEEEWHIELRKIRVHHATCMANTIQKHCQQKIMQKNIELREMYAKNRKLMENIDEVKAEVDYWRTRAAESELKLRNLQSELERVRNEECGENDAQSGVAGGIHSDMARRCLICKREEATILYLPCHHLSVCGGCDRSNIFACPVCYSPKTESIEVIFP